MPVPFKHIAVCAAILLATGGVTAGVASSGACEGGDASLMGRYRMTGVLGLGSTLSLKKDGSFVYALTYGALQQRGEGCWSQRGRTVALLPPGTSEVANRQTLDSTGFRGLALEARDDGALVWDIADSGRKAVYVKR